MAANCGRCGRKRAHLDHSRGVCEYVALAAEPKKRKAVNPMSDDMKAFVVEERRPLREQVFARDGWQCVILSPWHERLADWNPLTVHEKATRGREGGIRAEGVNTLENCVSACLRCNVAMSENPDWAEAHGWLLPASEVAK